MHIRLRHIAVPLALAILVFGGAYGVFRYHQARIPITIEIVGHEEAVMAAGQTAQRPRILLYHTHTWEAYEMTDDARYTPTQTWRTKDDAHNVVRVGAELARLLEERGFSVVHDTTAFEPPTLSSAYTRSLEMLMSRREAGERYDYIFDIHRDAYSGDWNGANAVGSGDGRLAYVMLLVGKGTGTTGAGFDERPDWPANLALAQALTDGMNALVPGVAREVKIKTGRFNQHVSSSALLIEVGNNRNTLSEALAACPVIADAIARVHAERTADGQ